MQVTAVKMGIPLRVGDQRWQSLVTENRIKTIEKFNELKKIREGLNLDINEFYSRVNAA